jgi:hypothetical protein
MKRYADHRWIDHEEEEDREYVWQKGQWCPPGLRRSQKRRVQHLRNQELKRKESRGNRCGVQMASLMDLVIRLLRA